MSYEEKHMNLYIREKITGRIINQLEVIEEKECEKKMMKTVW